MLHKLWEVYEMLFLFLIPFYEDRKATFNDLAEWYLNLRKVKRLKTYWDVVSAINILNNQYFGKLLVNKLKRSHIEEYQELRVDQGKAPSTIDKELRMFKTMIIRADDDDKIDTRILKYFRTVKKKLIKSGNARKRIISFPEYDRLIYHSFESFRKFLIVVFLPVCVQVKSEN